MIDRLINPMDWINSIDRESADIKFSYLLREIAMELFMYRQEHEISKKKMAKKIGVSKKVLSKLERCEYDINLKELYSIFDKLDIKVTIKIV